MAQLRQDYDRFKSLDAEVVVVGPENAPAFQAYFEDNQLPFVGLPDPEHRVLKLFGQEVNLFKLGRMPAQAIIDRRGIVRYIHYGKSMSDIPENEELFDLLTTLNAEAEVAGSLQ